MHFKLQKFEEFFYRKPFRFYDSLRSRQHLVFIASSFHGALWSWLNFRLSSQIDSETVGCWWCWRERVPFRTQLSERREREMRNMPHFINSDCGHHYEEFMTLFFIIFGFVTKKLKIIFPVLWTHGGRRAEHMKNHKTQWRVTRFTKSSDLSGYVFVLLLMTKSLLISLLFTRTTTHYRQASKQTSAQASKSMVRTIRQVGEMFHISVIFLNAFSLHSLSKAEPITCEKTRRRREKSENINQYFIKWKRRKNPTRSCQTPNRIEVIFPPFLVSRWWRASAKKLKTKNIYRFHHSSPASVFPGIPRISKLLKLNKKVWLAKTSTKGSLSKTFFSCDLKGVDWEWGRDQKLRRTSLILAQVPFMIPSQFSPHSS